MSTPQNVTELINELQELWRKNLDPFYPDAKWMHFMTTKFMTDGNTEPEHRYIVQGHGRREIVPSFNEHSMTEDDAELICRLRNAFPSIAASFLANEEKVRKQQDLINRIDATLIKATKELRANEDKLRIAVEALENITGTGKDKHGWYYACETVDKICKDALAILRSTPPYQP